MVRTTKRSRRVLDFLRVRAERLGGQQGNTWASRVIGVQEAGRRGQQFPDLGHPWRVAASDKHQQSPRGSPCHRSRPRRFPCCGFPCTHIYPSRSLIRKIWNLVVPGHSSEGLTSFASVQMSVMTFSDTLSILVRVCFIKSTYFNGIPECSQSGSCSFNRGSS